MIAFASVLLALSSVEAFGQDFWQACNAPNGGTVSSLAANSSGYLFAGTYEGGIYRSLDGGRSWTPTNNGLTSTTVMALAISSTGYAFAGTWGAGVFRSSDNGGSWVGVNLSPTNPIVKSLATSDGHIFVGTTSGVFRSTDNGGSWTAIGTGLTSSDVTCLAIDQGGYVFAGTASGGIFRSTDNGGSWTLANSGLGSYTVQSLAVDVGGRVFAGTPAGVFGSTDHGGNWTRKNNGLKILSVWSLVIDSRECIFAGTKGGGVFRSTDSGGSWKELNGGLADMVIYSLAIDKSGYLFAGTDSAGVYRSAMPVSLLPKGGSIHYVDNAGGSDSNDGLSPDSPKRSIGAAWSSAQSGDTIMVAGTDYRYDETVSITGKDMTFGVSNDRTPGVRSFAINVKGTPQNLVRFISPVTVDTLSLLSGQVEGSNLLRIRWGGKVLRTSNSAILGEQLGFEGPVHLEYGGTEDISTGPEVPVPTDTLETLTINFGATTRTPKLTLTRGNIITKMLGLVNGLVVTGDNVLILMNPVGKYDQGFVRNVIQGGKSHVVGNVRQMLKAGSIIAFARNEYPVGDTNYYRPAVLTLVNSAGKDVSLGISATIKFDPTRPTGVVGLPIKDGVSAGVDIARYPDFAWNIKTTGSLGSTQFDLELTAEGFSDFDDVANIRLIRRSGTQADVGNTWALQGAQYDNYVINSVPTVVNVNSTGGLIPGGAIYTYGLKTTLVVANPIPDQNLSVGSNPFTRDLANPPLFTGGKGALTFAAMSQNTAIVSASVAGTVLSVSPKAVGRTSVDVICTDSFDGSRAKHTFSVSVDTTRPAIILSRASISFGDVAVNGWKSDTLTLHNAGTAGLNVYSVWTDNAAFTVSPSTGFTLKPGDNQVLTVTFRPTVGGSQSATITIFHDASEKKSVVTAAGNGTTAPVADISRTSISFGDVAVNGWKSETLTLRNAGTADLNVSSIGSDNAAFIVSPSTGFTLQPGDSLILTVTFTPTAAGVQSATISIYHNASGSPSNVAASGTGTAAPAAAISRTSISFGNVSVNSSKSDTFTVRNRGTADLNVSSIRTDHTDFTVSPSTGFTLKPGNSQMLTVTFAPTGVGAQSATITLVCNIVGDTLHVLVSGVGDTRAGGLSTTIGRFSQGIPTSQWMLMSAPYRLDQMQGSTLANQIAGSDECRMYAYVDGNFQDITNKPDALQLTRGFWFKTLAPVNNLSFGAGTLTTGTSYMITVPIGWSIVGPPFYDADATWSPVNTVAGSVGIRVWKYLHESNRWGDAPMNPAVERMKPFGGYAVNNTTGAPADLTFLRGSLSAKVRSEWEDGDGWFIRLQVGDAVLRIGEHQRASVGDDEYDYPMPPKVPEATGEPAYVSNGLWSDIRPVEAQRVAEWEVTMNPESAHRICVKEMFKIPSGWIVVAEGIPQVGRVKLEAGRVFELPPSANAAFIVKITAGPETALKQAATPSSFWLGHNYPNPFNSSTTIPIFLPEGREVSLEIYTVLGEKVRTLFEGRIEPGNHLLKWDGADDRGGKLSSGVYVYRLRIEGGQMLVGKMLFLN